MEISSSYDISKNIQISGAVKKSLMTDFDQIVRYSNSKLPRVLSDFAIYDKEGQSGHLDNLMIKHRAKISKHIFSLMKVGYLEPMYAGISGELLHKNPKSNFAVGIDLNVVQMRDYDMQFGLRDYKTTSGQSGKEADTFIWSRARCFVGFHCYAIGCICSGARCFVGFHCYAIGCG